MKKYTIEEVAPECADLSFAFDDDGLTEAGTGDFCGNVFMLFWDRGWRAVSGRCNPVAVGLMDGGALHIIAIVCPINAELSRIEYAEAV